MIHFVVGEPGSFSIRVYLDEEGRGLRDRMRVVSYDELTRVDRLSLGTWVFTELDQLERRARASWRTSSPTASRPPALTFAS